jgi:hypothetical protein
MEEKNTGQISKQLGSRARISPGMRTLSARQCTFTGVGRDGLSHPAMGEWPMGD